jgi:hypothetical protein
MLQTLRYATSIIVLTLIACGANMTASAKPHENGWQSQLPGAWSGTWGNDYQIGTMSVTIDADGSFSGTLHNDTESLDGTVKGTIGASGAIPSAFTFGYRYGSDDYAGKGRALMDGRDGLVAVEELYLANGQHLGTIAIKLTKPPASAAGK